VGFVLGISIFEELEDDVRVVKRFPLISESGDQSFRIKGQQLGALVEWVGLDVFVRYSAFFEGYPTLLGKRAEPATIEDEFAIVLMVFYGLCRGTCGVRMDLKDVVSHLG